jgi:hypothetical protein
MLYTLSLNDFPVMNVRDATSKRRRISTSDNEASLKLWNCHLGHISRGRIKCLIKEEILMPLDFSDLGHYIECIKGKYVKHIKKMGATRSSCVLQIIHTDICSPFNVRYVDGFNLFITFTNDFSCYVYIYPMRERSEVLDQFMILKDEVENQHNAKIKMVHSDKEENITGGILLMGKFSDLLPNF